MLDEYFKFEEVNRLLFELDTNPKYYDKRIKDSNPIAFIKNNLTLYLFYDAIYKYKIIVDDIYLFNEFIDNLDKIFRKIDTIEDISRGINKLLCNLLSVTLDLNNIQDTDSKKLLVQTMYDRYIVNGYYVHGFPTIYEESIFRNGIRSGTYENNYPYMKNIDNIFTSHGVENVFNKDFSDKTMYFTDDLAAACHYSSVAPSYFSNLLMNDTFFNRNSIEDYQTGNYDNCIKGLMSYLDRSNFTKSEKDMVSKIVKNEWKFLNSVEKRISVLLIKRRCINNDCPKFEAIYNDEYDLYEMIDDILSLRYGNIEFNGLIEPKDIEVLSFYYPKEEKEEKIDAIRPEIKERDISILALNPLDSYGVASILILVGSLLISLGVIVSIISMGGFR